eukprot:COSAG02_NODE_60490_length_271_cov_0.604651_1_plen_49_part_01
MDQHAASRQGAAPPVAARKYCASKRWLSDGNLPTTAPTAPSLRQTFQRT